MEDVSTESITASYYLLCITWNDFLL